MSVHVQGGQGNGDKKNKHKDESLEDQAGEICRYKNSALPVARNASVTADMWQRKDQAHGVATRGAGSQERQTSKVVCTSGRLKRKVTRVMPEANMRYWYV